MISNVQFQMGSSAFLKQKQVFGKNSKTQVESRRVAWDFVMQGYWENWTTNFDIVILHNGSLISH